jgi:hypothetical protein
VNGSSDDEVGCRNSFKFGDRSHQNKFIDMSDPSSSPLLQAVAGGMAGIVSYATTYPLQTLSTRKQLQQNKDAYKGTLSALRKIIDDEGLSGLYRGLKRCDMIG